MSKAPGSVLVAKPAVLQHKIGHTPLSANWSSKRERQIVYVIILKA